MKRHYDYDIITIGLGPAGMAVSIMGSEMGLKVLAVEKHKIGGECMNVGCIPSKALLRMGKTRHVFDKLEPMALAPTAAPDVTDPFSRIAESIKYINDAKTVKMFHKVDLKLGEGDARFVDRHTVAVGSAQYTARKIFIATGTRPMVPPIPGIKDVDYLTNETMFKLDKVPESMVIIGGGAIGCEMAQAYARLGSKISIVQMDDHLIPAGDEDSGAILKTAFEKEGIAVHNSERISAVEKTGSGIVVRTESGLALEGEKLLVAAGRSMDFSSLGLEAAGIKHTRRGITVDKYLRTSAKSVYAVGDCNGHFLLSHAAMHQGMIALMNAMMPGPFGMDFRKYVVPWTVFTEPQVSHVGMRENELKEKKIRYETITVNYGDYGAAIAEDIATGFVRVFASKTGKVYGARIVGEGSGEMINEWALAIQKKIRLHDIMMLQHSFPTMGFLTKRIAETWMMNRMKSSLLQKMAQWMFRKGGRAPLAGNILSLSPKSPVGDKTEEVPVAAE